MKTLTHIISTAVVAALAFTAGTSSSPAGGRAIPQGPFATVDMEEVINNYANDTLVFENLKNEKKAKDASLDVIKDGIEARMQQLEITPRTAPGFLDLTKEIQLERQKLEIESRANEAHFANKKGDIVADIYKRAYQVIEAYAKEKGLLAVFLKTKPEMPKAAYQEVSNAIIVRSLVYGAEAVDITADIEKLMKK